MDRTQPLPPCRTSRALSPRSTPLPRRLRGAPGVGAKSPCSRCNRRVGCVAPCETLEALLPGERDAEPCLPIPADVAETAGEWRRENGQTRKFLFRIFLKHSRELTRAQRKVVQLVYGDDLSTREAGEALGISQSAASQRLTAARGRILRKNLIESRTGGGTQENDEPKTANESAAQTPMDEEDRP